MKKMFFRTQPGGTPLTSTRLLRRSACGLPHGAEFNGSRMPVRETRQNLEQAPNIRHRDITYFIDANHFVTRPASKHSSELQHVFSSYRRASRESCRDPHDQLAVFRVAH
jgi:hypothetical protein